MPCSQRNSTRPRKSYVHSLIRAIFDGPIMQGIKGPVLFSLLLVSIIAFAGRSAVVDSNSGLKDLIRKLSVVSDDPARSVMSSLPSQSVLQCYDLSRL